MTDGKKYCEKKKLRAREAFLCRSHGGFLERWLLWGGAVGLPRLCRGARYFPLEFGLKFLRKMRSSGRFLYIGLPERPATELLQLILNIKALQGRSTELQIRTEKIIFPNLICNCGAWWLGLRGRKVSADGDVTRTEPLKKNNGSIKNGRVATLPFLMLPLFFPLR